MWRFGSCPKCGGDIFVSPGLSGWYAECLQCGYRKKMREVLPSGRHDDKVFAQAKRGPKPKKQSLARHAN